MRICLPQRPPGGHNTARGSPAARVPLFLHLPTMMPQKPRATFLFFNPQSSAYWQAPVMAANAARTKRLHIDNRAFRHKSPFHSPKPRLFFFFVNSRECAKIKPALLPWRWLSALKLQRPRLPTLAPPPPPPLRAESPRSCPPRCYSTADPRSSPVRAGASDTNASVEHFCDLLMSSNALYKKW